MKEPKYREIVKDIKNKIDERVYLPGQKIPIEVELAKFYNTSRQTVNKALRDLVLEGVIVRYPKNGTFITIKDIKTSILDLKDVQDDIKKRKQEYSKEVILVGEVKADLEIARILHVVKDQRIYISKIIHKENNVPVRYDVRYINPICAPEYSRQTFEDINPTEYLKRVSPVEEVENNIEAVLVNSEIQDFLEIKEKEPCLLISRVVVSNTRVASYSKLFYPTSRYKLTTITKA